MKKLSLVALLLLTIGIAQAQYKLAKGNAQLNAGVGFSGWGIPVYFGFDYGVHRDISIGAELSFRSYTNRWGYYDKGNNLRNDNFTHSIFGVSANGNYHFNTLLKIPKEWDFYAGLNLGVYFWSSPSVYNGNGGTQLGLGAQVGGRYYFTKNWGINLELGGGNVFSGGKFGATYAF